MKDKQRPRVPPPAVIELPGEDREIQVNHCKMPGCDNFGVPARWEPSKRGPSSERDLAYNLQKGKGIPGIRCKACGDGPPVKSNAAIARELARLSRESGIWRPEELTGCRSAQCENHARPISFHPDAYRKRGKPPSGQGQIYECRACGRRTRLSDAVRLHDRHRRMAADIFGRIANKAPVRGCCRGGGIKSPDSYYDILDFIHRRCRAYSGTFDRALIDGRLPLPGDMNVETDAQVYRLNWISRMDRRNVELSAYATVHDDSRFVLAMHTNYDGHVDPFEINKAATVNGDLEVPEAFREYAQYWLTGDELREGRSMGLRDDKVRINLLRQIERLYADASSREDVENIETAGAQHELHDTVSQPRTAGPHAVHRLCPLAPRTSDPDRRRRQAGAGEHGYRLDGARRISVRIRGRGAPRRRTRVLRPRDEVPDH